MPQATDPKNDEMVAAEGKRGGDIQMVGTMTVDAFGRIVGAPGDDSGVRGMADGAQHR